MNYGRLLAAFGVKPIESIEYQLSALFDETFALGVECDRVYSPQDEEAIDKRREEIKLEALRLYEERK